MKKIIFYFLLCVSMNAQTIYVNSSTGNDGTGDGSSGSPYKSFNTGYIAVSDGGTLDLTGTFTWTDAAESGDVTTTGYTIAKNITIQGQGADQTIIQAASSSGSADRRIFTFSSGVTVTIKNLELRYGKTSGSNDGGAINGYQATITILNCYIHDNQARQGGAIFVNTAPLEITGSTISNNTSSGGSGSLWGAAILSSGPSNVTSNSLIITNSTITGNSGQGYGGGIAITNYATANSLTNCTIVSNSCTNSGGGVDFESGTLRIKNTMIANNSGSSGADFDHLAGTLTDNGYNIVENDLEEGGSGTFSGTGTITGNQTNLFGSGVSSTPSLASNSTLNGTPTLVLSAGSVAIDAGNSSANGSVSVPTTDQRGATRNGTTDIGAYEYNGTLPVELTTFNVSVTDNKINLNWQTATEVNNFGFDVERSSSIQEVWEKIGFVQGHGNSNSPKEYSFTDKPNGGSELKYRLKQIDTDGKYEYSPEVKVSLNILVDFLVKQNFPNPFNPTTKIEFSIPSDNNVEIKVFNALGMEVATLLNEHRQAGTHIIEFNASNLASGIYFYKIVSGKYSEIKKMILLR